VKATNLQPRCAPNAAGLSYVSQEAKNDIAAALIYVRLLQRQTSLRPTGTSVKCQKQTSGAQSITSIEHDELVRAASICGVAL